MPSNPIEHDPSHVIISDERHPGRSDFTKAFRQHSESATLARARHGNEEQMAAELADMKLLHAMSTQLAQEQKLESLYKKVLDSAVAIMHSDFASMQMLYPDRGSSGELRLLASHGFNEEAERGWEWVSAESKSSCGAALRNGARVIVEDIEKWELAPGTEGLAAYLKAGMHAMQSTPLISRSGKVVGMISTHWRTPYRPSERELDLFDILARQATELIEHKRADEELRESEERFRAIFEQTTGGVAQMDLTGRFVLVNDRYCEITGRSREELMKLKIQDVTHAGRCGAGFVTIH